MLTPRLPLLVTQRADPLPDGAADHLSASVLAACAALRDAAQGALGTNGDVGPEADSQAPAMAPAAEQTAPTPPAVAEQDYGLDELALS